MSSLVLALPAAAFGTSVLSAVLGMGGGMILMGIYGLLLPVASAMVLHGVTQLAANGFRAALLRRHVRTRVLPPYLLGAAAAALLLRSARVVPSTAAVLLALGLLPWLRALLPARLGLDVERPRVALACGFGITAVQVLAGVAGPLLDLFFLESRLGRREIVATKALTQTVSHALKLVHYLSLAAAGEELSPALLLAVVGASFLGTAAGRRVLERLREEQFRRWAGHLLRGIGAVYAWRAAVAWGG